MISNPTKETALITGSSSGIGYELAKEFAARGCDVVLVSNESEKLEQVKAQIERDYRVTAHVIPMDLARQQAAEDLFAECRRRGLVITILVNNAGMFFFGEAVMAQIERAIMLLNLHVITPTMLAVLFGRQMKERGHGYILFISSISAYKAFPGISFYGSTKTYLMNFAKSLRSEMKSYGVFVTCVCPGATATNLYDAAKTPVNMDLALKTGIMATPDKVARHAVDSLFKKKAVTIPGVINKIMVLIALLIPQWVIDFIKERTRFLKT
jgi:uncharacterized protein